ncbi:unnamed protein product, partial [Amoebophrya sp. A120]|eukprot:GSA120T00003178001.1
MTTLPSSSSKVPIRGDRDPVPGSNANGDEMADLSLTQLWHHIQDLNANKLLEVIPASPGAEGEAGSAPPVSLSGKNGGGSSASSSTSPTRLRVVNGTTSSPVPTAAAVAAQSGSSTTSSHLAAPGHVSEMMHKRNESDFDLRERLSATIDIDEGLLRGTPGTEKNNGAGAGQLRANQLDPPAKQEQVFAFSRKPLTDGSTAAEIARKRMSERLSANVRESSRTSRTASSMIYASSHVVPKQYINQRNKRGEAEGEASAMVEGDLNVEAGGEEAAETGEPGRAPTVAIRTSAALPVVPQGASSAAGSRLSELFDGRDTLAFNPQIPRCDSRMFDTTQRDSTLSLNSRESIASRMSSIRNSVQMQFPMVA